MTDWFWPGYKAGGPITSLVNLVQAIPEADFLVVTRDRDLHAESPYPDVIVNEWVNFRDHVRVMYLSPDRLNRRGISDIIRSQNFDLCYLNSMFSRHFTLVPLMVLRRMGALRKTVLAPRGMLKPGALSVKPGRKRVFLLASRIAGWYKGISWHATTMEEESEIRAFAGKHAHISVAPNIPFIPDRVQHLSKYPGELSVITISRVSPEKGVEEAIRCMLHPALTGIRVKWTLVGAIPDTAYARKCRFEIPIPGHIRMEWLGELEPQAIPPLIRQNHILLSLTRGENFGHAIIEALLNGRPVVISDQTPWRGLKAAEAGFDLPAGDPDAVARALSYFSEMSQESFDHWCDQAAAYAADRIREQDAIGATQRLLGVAR